MQTITNTKSLTAAIGHLENVQASELNLLKQHYHFTVHSLNPLNMIKEKFEETFSSPDLRSNLIKGAIGIATSLVTNKLIVGSSHNIIKQAIGGLVQNNLSKITSIDTEELKETGKSFLKNVLSKIKIK